MDLASWSDSMKTFVSARNLNLDFILVCFILNIALYGKWHQVYVN